MSFGNYSVLFTGIGDFDIDNFIQELIFDYITDETTYSEFQVGLEFDPDTGAMMRNMGFEQAASIEGYASLLSDIDMTILLEIEEQEAFEDCTLYTYTPIEPNTAYTPEIQINNEAVTDIEKTATTLYSSAETNGLTSKFGFLSGSTYQTMLSSSLESLVRNMSDIPIDNSYYPRVYSKKVQTNNLTSVEAETMQTGSTRYGTSSLAEFTAPASEGSY